MLLLNRGKQLKTHKKENRYYNLNQRLQCYDQLEVNEVPSTVPALRDKMLN